MSQTCKKCGQNIDYSYPPLLHALTDRESWCYWKGYADGKNKRYDEEERQLKLNKKPVAKARGKKK